MNDLCLIIKELKDKNSELEYQSKSTIKDFMDKNFKQELQYNNNIQKLEIQLNDLQKKYQSELKHKT